MYEVHVTDVGNKNFIYRMVDFEQGFSEPVGETSSQDWEKVSQFVKGSYFPAIQTAGQHNYLANGELKTALLNIEGLGHELYEKFIPQELRDYVGGLPDGSVVRFVSKEQGIPWELVYNGKGFWGNRLILCRVDANYNVRIDATRSPRYRKILNIVGATMNEKIKKRVFRLFDSVAHQVSVINIDGGQLNSLADLVEYFGEADLIHFTCHGELTNMGLYLQLVKSKIPTLNLMPSAVGILPIEPGCTVFANACVSAGFQPGIDQLLSFGTMFCSNTKRGGAYIGTLDLVPGLPAVLFAETFYNYLFTGNSVGESLYYAKNSQFNDGKTRFGLFPLIYSLYGNPHI